MKGINILIVEDELIVSEELMELLTAAGYQVIGQLDTGQQVLDFIKKDTPDVILMDINIKGSMDGIELAEAVLRHLDVAIIFLTAYYDDHFINRAKRVKPAAYLVKPFDEKSLLASIEIAFANRLMSYGASHHPPEHIFVKNKEAFVKFACSEILFAQASGSYIELILKNDKQVLSMNLKQFETRLDHPDFIRVHRSYLVNIAGIEKILGNQIQIGSHLVPINPETKKILMDRIKTL